MKKVITEKFEDNFLYKFKHLNQLSLPTSIPTPSLYYKLHYQINKEKQP